MAPAAFIARMISAISWGDTPSAFSPAISCDSDTLGSITAMLPLPVWPIVIWERGRVTVSPDENGFGWDKQVLDACKHACRRIRYRMQIKIDRS